MYISANWSSAIKDNAMRTWTAIEEDAKFVISYKVGDRTYESARMLFDDLKTWVPHRLWGRTNRLPSYAKAIWDSFPLDATHEVTDGSAVYNAYVEWQYLNMRMGMRRYTRKTNNFSKRITINTICSASTSFSTTSTDDTCLSTCSPPPKPSASPMKVMTWDGW